MEKEQKVRVVFEFDRSDYDVFCFFAKVKKDAETEAVWAEISKAPITAKVEAFGDQEQMMRLAIVGLAIQSVEDKLKEII